MYVWVARDGDNREEIVKKMKERKNFEWDASGSKNKQSNGA